MKYKIGDKVRITGKGYRGGWNSSGRMDTTIGEIGEIIEHRNNSSSYDITFGDNWDYGRSGRKAWTYTEDNLELYDLVPEDLFIL